jgi:hypothetical protein
VVDGDGSDVYWYYTSALDSLGADYDYRNTETGDPTFNDIFEYITVLWYTALGNWNTITDYYQMYVAAYLDAGGTFFLSNLGYLGEMGLTSIGIDYLYISSYDYDVGQPLVIGPNVFSGLEALIA